jgi:hypothetical protein
MGHAASNEQLEAEPDIGPKAQMGLIVFMILFVIFCIVNFVGLYAYFLWEVDRAKETNQRLYPLIEFSEHEKASAPVLAGEKGTSIDKASQLIIEKYKK